MAAWSRNTLKKKSFFAFLGKPTSYEKIFKKFCSERIHRDTDRRVMFKFREIWPTGNRQNRELLTWQKSFAWLPSSRQPQTMYSKCSRFHPNRFTFGTVISERVNTVRGRSEEVNAIFGKAGNIRQKPSFEQYNELIHVVAHVQLTMANNIHSLTI